MIEEDTNIGKNCFIKLVLTSGPRSAAANVWQRGIVIHEHVHSYTVRLPNVFDEKKTILKELPKNMVVIA